MRNEFYRRIEGVSDGAHRCRATTPLVATPTRIREVMGPLRFRRVSRRGDGTAACLLSLEPAQPALDVVFALRLVGAVRPFAGPIDLSLHRVPLVGAGDPGAHGLPRRVEPLFRGDPQQV